MRKKPMPDPTHLARIAYDAYGKTTEYKNFRGEPMPKWENLGFKIQQAWINAAYSVAQAVANPAITAASAASSKSAGKQS